MPKRPVFKKNQIHEKAFEIFKTSGLDEITARNLAKALDCSPAPIYTCYLSMDELKEELIEDAKEIFMEYIKKPYTDMIFLNIGIGFCAFARDEKELFKSIFLKDNSYEDLLRKFRDFTKEEMEKDPRFDNIPEDLKIDLFLDCWLFAHGFATLISTELFKNPSNEEIQNRLLNSAAIMLYKRLDELTKQYSKKKK